MSVARFRLANRTASIAAGFVAWFFLAWASFAHAAENIAISNGTIDGARFEIARPANWNRNLLLFAHGYVSPEAAVGISIDTHNPAYARLLEDGWMIAATSYRRNGVIVRDAIADIDALRDHIEQTAGTPGLVILLGESMGGAIVTHIAEGKPGRFHGAVAIDAALRVQDPKGPLDFTHAPKIPILFVVNQSELAESADYFAAAANAPVPPALWTIARDGHVNVNADERLRALDGLIRWITTSRIERQRDATVPLEESGPGEIVFVDGEGRGAVRSVTENHGNIFTTFRPVDFATLGIAKGAMFELTAGGKKFRVLYGTDFSDVARGAWVAFPRAEGVIVVARNFENAATTAGVKAGDPLVVRALKR